MTTPNERRAQKNPPGRKAPTLDREPLASFAYPDHPDAFVGVDPSGLTVGWSREAEQLLGWSAAEILGRSWIDRAVAEDYREPVRQLLQTAARKGPAEASSVRSDCLLTSQGGSLLRATLSLTLLRQGKDLSFGIVIQEHSPGPGHLVKTLFEAAGEGIVLLDADSTEILDANATACAMHGYAPGELKGLRIGDLLPPHPDPTLVSEIKDSLGRTGFFESDRAVHRRKDGTLFPCGINLRQMSIEGRTFKIALFRDLTNQVDAKDRLREAREHLERTVRERTAELVTTHDALKAQVAERRASEDALRQSEARLKMLITQLPAVLWTTDTELRFTSMMGASLATLTITPAMVMGRTMGEIMGNGEDGIRTVECHRQALRGQPASYVILMKERFFHSHVEPLRGADGSIIGVIGVSLDDSGRMRAEKAVHESEERYRRIFEVAPVAIGISSKDRIRYVNPAWLRMFGYSRAEEVLGASLFEHLAPESQKLVRERMLRREREGVLPGGVELVGLRKDGSRFAYYVDPCLLPTPDGDAMVAIGTDITERRRAENVLRDAHEELERKVAQRTADLAKAAQETRIAYENLKETQAQLIRTEKLASIGMLVSGVAHEINNPLNVIRGNLKLLTDKERLALICRSKPGKAGPRLRETRKIRGMLHDATRAADRACAIIETFRSFARDTRSADKVDLNACLHEAAELIERHLPSPVSLVRRLGVIPKVPCFRVQISQVFINLIRNAAEAIEGKGRIVVRSRKKRNAVLIEVSDNGKGMSPQVQAKVFDPFFTTKPLGKGLGLGLSISAMIVHNHGGTIHLESSEGKGTTFRIELPLSPDRSGD